MGTDNDETVSVRILPVDKKKVSEQAVGKEPFPYVLHRIIEAGIRTIEETKARDP